MIVVRVDVTKEDIQNGERAGCYDCPVALAIERAAGRQAHVYGKTVELDGAARQVYLLPTEAIRWYQAFDEGEPVEPFSFELEIRN